MKEAIHTKERERKGKEKGRKGRKGKERDLSLDDGREGVGELGQEQSP